MVAHGDVLLGRGADEARRAPDLRAVRRVFRVVLEAKEVVDVDGDAVAAAQVRVVPDGLEPARALLLGLDGLQLLLQDLADAARLQELLNVLLRTVVLLGVHEALERAQVEGARLLERRDRQPRHRLLVQLQLVDALCHLRAVRHRRRRLLPRGTADERLVADDVGGAEDGHGLRLVDARHVLGLLHEARFAQLVGVPEHGGPGSRSE
mmetsp:Transcript_3500/g.10864  ORF Transcript_3500/g.10864 Transcript_3500/m.10864 type:complete len:208 (-) Transcript_3500:74-697(-)